MLPTASTWIRRLARQCGAYVALLALALQFGAMFGHVHADEFVARGVSSTSGQVLSGPLGTQIASASPWTLAADDDLCPICFSGALLANSFLPTAAEPPHLLRVADIRHVLPPGFGGALDMRRAPFQSRAPPRA